MQSCFCYLLSERQNKDVLNANEALMRRVVFRTTHPLGAVLFVENNQM